MPKLEYVNVFWDGHEIWLSPIEKFDLGWFQQKFPRARITKSDQWAAYHVDKLGESCGLAVITIINHLGEEEWEAVTFDGVSGGGGKAWFRRPLVA